METIKSRPSQGARRPVPPPVLTWSLARNKTVPDPSPDDIRGSGLPLPPPRFLTPMAPFHRSWRSFVFFLTRLFKLKEADAFFRNIPAYFVDVTLKGRDPENGGLLSRGRFWKVQGEDRKGLGTNALILVHRAGLAAYESKGRRSLRLVFTRLREFVVERAMHLLVLFVAAPVILTVERGGLLPKIITIIIVAAVAVRLPSLFIWLVELSPGMRTWIKAFAARRRQRIEARDIKEARGLLEKAIRSSKTLFIPWTEVVKASFALDSSFRQIMVDGPPAALWTLTWETQDGRRDSAVVSVPVRSMGYPALGFADLRLAAELTVVPKNSIQSELQAFAAIPGMEDWIRGSHIS